jgi:hypothetical protein
MMLIRFISDPIEARMQRLCLAALASLLLAIGSPAFAQPLAVAPTPPPPKTPPAPPPTDDNGLTVRDSSVGYIDAASPSDQARLRADLGFGFHAPNRAELFYAQGQPGGPGVPRPERNVDFQDYTLYLEKTVASAWSVFAEGGVRYINPEVNANAHGWSDVNVGFKYAFFSNESSIATFQLRAYLPTGDADRGLGTDHVSLEPALLGFARLTENLGVAAELRYWQPVDGTSFAGSMLRYGLGLRYDAWRSEECRFAPVAEAIGWCVLGGRESTVLPSGLPRVRDAAGTNVVNLKLGARLDLGDRAGLYAGYGWALTGDRWYSDIVRIEFRWLY